MNQFKITDIFFDLDHTLWDFEVNSKLAFEKLLKKHELPVGIDDFIQVYEPINLRYWEEYSKGLKTKEQVKYDRLTKTFQSLKIDVTFDLIKLLANEYLDFLKREKTLMEGTVELLDYLKDKYRLHILTNGFIEVQQDKLQNAGISFYFDYLISSESIGKQKPHPDVFQFALRTAKTVAHRSYMIGDNFQSDILGAKNVGMHAIHFDPFKQSSIDNHIIPKVDKLIQIKELL
jgi:putative hydrolase of the HAD superfamily